MNIYILLIINIILGLINFIFLLSLSTFLVNLASSLDSFKNDVEEYLLLKINAKKQTPNSNPNPNQESGLVDV